MTTRLRKGATKLGKYEDAIEREWAGDAPAPALTSQRFYESQRPAKLMTSSCGSSDATAFMTCAFKLVTCG